MNYKKLVSKVISFLMVMALVLGTFAINGDDTFAAKKKAGYVKVKGVFYYYKKGRKQKGTVYIKSKPYYFYSSGKAAKKGWIKYKNGKKKYSLGKGKLVTGKVKMGSYYYYFTKKAGYYYKRVKIVQKTSKMKIMGKTTVSYITMANYYKSMGKTYPSYYGKHDDEATTIEDFCRIYVEEANKEGIRGEVGFMQAMKETGWLKFGNDVKVSQFNFAGIGATGGGKAGHSFESVRVGIRAQIQHLKGYATTESLNTECVDPRYDILVKVGKLGTAPYVEDLGGNWATDKSYGYDLVEMIKRLCS